MTWQLVVARGSREGKAVPLDRFPFRIGREPDCDLRPSSQSISRRHCEIRSRKGALLVRDCGTTNGTIVNGRRISGDRVLLAGDTLEIGPLTFRVEESGVGELDEHSAAELLLMTDDEGHEETLVVEPPPRPTLAEPVESEAASAARRIIEKYRHHAGR